LVLSKEKYWNTYQKDCLKRISDLSTKEYSNARQSLGQKISQLKIEQSKETDKMRVRAIQTVIDTLEMFKKRIR
jgi:hypothetical protein